MHTILQNLLSLLKGRGRCTFVSRFQNAIYAAYKTDPLFRKSLWFPSPIFTPLFLLATFLPKETYITLLCMWVGSDLTVAGYQK